MKYRIKTVTYQNGRKAYFAQYKTWLRWVGIAYDGKAHIVYDGEYDTREKALSKIDLHYNGNTKEQSIVFEYIKK